MSAHRLLGGGTGGRWISWIIGPLSWPRDNVSSNDLSVSLQSHGNLVSLHPHESLSHQKKLSHNG